MNPRPTVDHVLMAAANLWEHRSTCSRNQVGVVIAKDGRHIGSGYNGAPAGMPHCEHPVMEIRFNIDPPAVAGVAWPADRGCRVAIHAEANALAYCARNGVAVEGATIYTTLSPCHSCAQLIVAAGLVRVVYGRAYRDVDGINLLVSAGVVVEKWM